MSAPPDPATPPADHVDAVDDDALIPSLPRTVPTNAERAAAAALPLGSRFTLGDRITGVQQAFIDQHGFAVFGGVAAPDEVAQILASVDDIQAKWLAEGRQEVNGIPLYIGQDEAGAPFIQRFAFTSMCAPYIHRFVRDARFLPIRSLIGEQTRVGDAEKDGVVFNRNMTVPGSAYSRLGWHTDGLRDLFMLHPDWPWLRPPGPMLNVGMHFDHVRAEDGGLRLIPGSHTQGLLPMMFGKPYFVSHHADRREVAVETQPGDLTVHDGRLWHRVARSPHTGRRSLRRTMYVPYLVDTQQIKTDRSRTPFYHRLGRPLSALVRTG